MLLYILYYILPISSSRYVICASLQLPSNPEIKKAFFLIYKINIYPNLII